MTKDDNPSPLAQLLQRIDLGQEYPDAHSAVISANGLSVKQGEELQAEYDAYCAKDTRECPQCGRFVAWRVCITDGEAQGCAGWKLPYPRKELP